MKLFHLISPSVLGLAFLASCGSSGSEKTAEATQSISLTNTSSTVLTDKAVVIERNAFQNVPASAVAALLTFGEDTIPSQLDDLDGDGKWDELFFVADFAANETKSISLSWSDSAFDFPMRTSVRFGKKDGKKEPVHPILTDTMQADEVRGALGYQPYQTDGPTWENDKVGFRHYFDGRNSKDLYGKITKKMSPDTVGIGPDGGVKDTYHVMCDWGRDILSVGNSAGLGGFEMMHNDSIYRLGVGRDDTLNNIETSVFNITVEGPARSIGDFSYFNWDVAGTKYNAKESVSIWPGMYAYESKLTIDGFVEGDTVIVGLVKRHTKKPLVELAANEKFVALYTHDKQSYDKEWYLGMALIIPKDVYVSYGEAPKKGDFTKSYYAKLNMKDHESVKYYSVGCWGMSDTSFRDSAYFDKYLRDLTDQLAAEIEISIK